jgi:hypothetical protein
MLQLGERFAGSIKSDTLQLGEHARHGAGATTAGHLDFEFVDGHGEFGRRDLRGWMRHG